MTTVDAGDSSDCPVLIVGAGPTGLVLAIELARRGVPVHLIDRQPEPAPWSAAIYIKSRTLEILADLGLLDRFLERGERVRGVKVFLGAEEVAGFPFDTIDSPYPYILSIPRRTPFGSLRKNSRRCRGPWTAAWNSSASRNGTTGCG